MKWGHFLGMVVIAAVVVWAANNISLVNKVLG